jgi:hypothetical protein
MDRRPTIAWMIPGEHFHRKVMCAGFSLLIGGMAKGLELAPLFGYASSPHVTRGALTLEVLNAPSGLHFDYAFWTDDDNVVTPDDLGKLVAILESRPDVDIAAGWCWIEGDVQTGRAQRVSAGMWAKDFTQQSFSAEAMELEASRNKLMVAEWTGFPCVLMRYDVLRKLGPHPFAGIPSDVAMHGMWGEDISFCIRAQKAGLTIVVDPTVKVEHLKTQPIPDPPERKVIDLATPLAKVARKIKYSICHTSARPNKWREAFERWHATAAGTFEYVLCADERWGFERCPRIAGPDVVVWNQGRKCAVDGWNTAFYAASGDVLIMAADDFFPPADWDTMLSESIGVGHLDPQTEDFAIRVLTSNPNQGRNLFALIISRARYKRLGYALWHEYDCMYSDDDYCEHILMDVAEGRSRLIDARHVLFEEKHPSFSGEPMDEVYEHQMRSEGWDIGAEVLARRRQSRFEGAKQLQEIAL